MCRHHIAIALLVLQVVASTISVRFGPIKCIGSPPTYRLPMLQTARETIDTNRLTLQQICAATEYGGALPHHNVGGKCFLFEEYEERPGVDPIYPMVFESRNTRPALFDNRLQSPRLLAYCAQRCFCSHQPNPETDMSLLTQWTDTTAFLIKPELPGEFLPTGFRYETDQLGTFPSRKRDFAVRLSQTQLERVPVTLPVHNEVQCWGGLPPWPMQYLSGPDMDVLKDAPVRTNNTSLPLRSAQQLCANVYSGGNPFFNAGLYCARLNDTFGYVDWAEEITPNLGLSFPVHPYQSLAVRTYCHFHCRCSRLRDIVTESNTNPRRTIWERGFDAEYTKGGGVILHTPGGPYPIVEDVTSTGSSRAGTCGADGRQFCQKPLPGGVMDSEPPSASAVSPPNLPGEDIVPLQQCGQTCETQSDCTGSWDGGCRCLIPKTQPEYVPLDPIFPTQPTFPKGRCLQMPSFALTQAMSLLGKRNVTEGVDAGP